MILFQAGDNYYFLQQQGRGPTLFLLHGFTGSTESWESQMAAFSNKFHTVAIDILGHGRSDSPAERARYTMNQIGADIVTLLEQVTTEPVHLLGYSMGGRLALYLAVTYPQHFQSLILESASPGLKTAEERQQRIRSDERLAQQIEQNGIEAFVAYWEQLPLFATQRNLPSRVREALHRQRLANRQEGLANALRGLSTGAQPSLWPHLDKLRIPVLLLAGELDQKFAAIAQEMAQAIPQAQLNIVPRTGHTIHLERPKLFEKLVLAFLDI